MSTYQCPKCFNILPISNKILHDLKCTKERPVEFSQENPYTSSASGNIYFNPEGVRYSSNDYTNLRISNSDFNLASELRNSAGSRYYKRMSYMNDDGTTTEIKKETNMSGKEELLEITYDPQGNIIGRKKADGGRSSVRFNFHELQNYSTYDPMDNYNIYEGGNVYVQTVPATEIVYLPVESYTVDYSNNYNNNNYFEHDFGSRGYSLMNNDMTNGQMVDLNNNNNNSNIDNYFSNNNNYTTQTNYENYNNNYNYTNNTGNYNYSNINSNINYQSANNKPFECAKVTKLTNNFN